MTTMVFKGKAAEAVLAALSAPRAPMTREQRFEQKVSFAYSCVAGDGITKDQVRAVLAAADGEPQS